MPSISGHDIILSNGSQIVHGLSAKTKSPFVHIPVTLSELDSGHQHSRPAFRGQSGFIEFNTDMRLPRHIHISHDVDEKDVATLLYERIFVVGGVALVELGGDIYVIPPQTLVTIAPGVPHTWTACPKGVSVAKTAGLHNGDQIVSEGKFLMLYEYEEITGFFPTAQTETLKSAKEYIRCNDLESIQIPALTVQDVKDKCWFVKDDQIFRVQQE